MKKPIAIQALYATSLVAFLISSPVHAELKAMKQQAIVEDSITPEASADEEVVVVKKVKKPARRVVLEEEPALEPAAPAASVNNNAQAIAIAQAPVEQKATAGAQLDAGIKSKMSDVQNQFEAALLKTLDRIKISVDDGSAPAAAPAQTAIIQDNLVSNQAAANKDYLEIGAAGSVADDEEADGESIAKIEKKSSERKVRVAPLFGRTMIGSNYYNIDSRYTAGFEIEMDLDSNFSLALGYAYSQYNIGLASSSPFVGFYQPYGYNYQNSQTLGYNQNVFTGIARLYLMPSEKKFRIFGGAGAGYNLGYLNYRQTNNGYGYQYYGYNNGVNDYEVKSWLGILNAGATLNVSDSVSIGADFRYALVFSSSENAPLNNYAFGYNGFNYGTTGDQAVVGGSLANENFYSILGTLKVAF